MKALVKVEKNGITIPIEMLGVNEGDILEIQTEKVYVSEKEKKLFSNKIVALA
jgi:hypothetical protein